MTEATNQNAVPANVSEKEFYLLHPADRIDENLEVLCASPKFTTRQAEAFGDAKALLCASIVKNGGNAALDFEMGRGDMSLLFRGGCKPLPFVAKARAAILVNKNLDQAKKDEIKLRFLEANLKESETEHTEESSPFKIPMRSLGLILAAVVLVFITMQFI